MYLPRSSGQISQHKEEYGNSQKRIAVIVLFFTMILSGVSFLAPSNIIAQEVHSRQASSQQERISFRVVSWNIENLFDTHHDSLKNDHEYLPDAIRHWNYSRYKKKLADVNPEKPDVPLNKNDAFQKVQKRRVQENGERGPIQHDQSPPFFFHLNPL